MKVIIIGAGIGGTSAGIALKRLGHDVVIYDRMKENKPVGAALSLWEHAQQRMPGQAKVRVYNPRGLSAGWRSAWTPMRRTT